MFTHHFGGTSQSTKRHQEFVNSLGFDCVSFDLESKWKLGSFCSFGKIWVRQLLGVLNEVPGDKIIYSFSSPSVATASAIVDHHRQDIRAWICDGGPFMQAFRCLENFYELQMNFSGFRKPAAAAIAYVIIGAIGYKSRVKRWMKMFPAHVPVLSIRAGQDKMVPVEAIDQFFADRKKMNLTAFEVKDAGHLEGLKNFPDLYKPEVKAFLLRVSRAINN